MTKKKVDRLSVIHRKEIIWLQWYFLKDKKNPGKTILESKIENAMLSGHHFQAKKYLVIKNATEIMLNTTDERMMRTIKEVFVYQHINVIGACQRILYLSPTAAYNHLNNWFKSYADMIFVFVTINK